MEERRESTETGKHRDMDIKTVKGQDNEGRIKGSKQAKFNEQRAQEAQRREYENPLNRTDTPGNTSGTEQV